MLARQSSLPPLPATDLLQLGEHGEVPPKNHTTTALDGALWPGGLTHDTRCPIRPTGG